MPILKDFGAPAAFFIATDYVGASPQSTPDVCRRFFEGRPRLLEFLTWDDCQTLAAAGMTIGSHTASHAHLIDCSAEEVAQEMRRSKAVIEERLARHCDHFCCPNGQPGVDFMVDRDPALARMLGYASFLTTRRGSAYRRSTPYLLERDKLIAAWGLHQLRYFFSR
jgi:peptidoglycan/xylan/chitin deacetylase (PgdA/CDA1 family)